MSFTLNSDLLALKNELTTDPKTLGLTTLAADDAANADKLNLVRVALQIKKTSLTTRELFNAVDPIEDQAMSNAQDRWFSEMLTLGQINPSSDQTILDGLIGPGGIFGSSSKSYAAINALLLHSGNRIDQMFQTGLLSKGGTVTPSDVANARNAS